MSTVIYSSDEDGYRIIPNGRRERAYFRRLDESEDYDLRFHHLFSTRRTAEQAADEFDHLAEVNA